MIPMTKVFNGEASKAFGTFGMVPNQTGSPTFNPKMYKVIIKGTSTFTKKGKEQESPCEGIP
jgi:hypothetical protein